MAITATTRKTLYIGGSRVDMILATMAGNDDPARMRIHNIRTGVAMTPVSVSTGGGDITCSFTNATTFPTVGALVTFTPTAANERVCFQAWGV